MQRNYTSRLFYGEFAYKILFARTASIGDPDYYSGWTTHNCRSWLGDQKIEHRMYNRVRYKGKIKNPKTVVIVNSSLFLKNKEDFDKVVDKWKDNIESITAPYNDGHVDVLKDNTEIIVRDTLVYRRFKYIVLFKRQYKERIDDIADWIYDTFDVTPSLVSSTNAKWHPSGWNPRLYLIDESDLMLTKLTWGDRIRSITVICTYDELNAGGAAVP